MTFRYEYYEDQYKVIKSYLKTLKLVSVTLIRLGDFCVVWTHTLFVGEFMFSIVFLYGCISLNVTRQLIFA